jgi:hypothetical protein
VEASRRDESAGGLEKRPPIVIKPGGFPYIQHRWLVPARRPNSS